MIPTLKLSEKANLKMAENYLAIAADFFPKKGRNRSISIASQVLNLSDELKDKKDLTIKVESGLRIYGYSLIEALKRKGRKVFADTKYSGVGYALSIDAAVLRDLEPEYLTIMCSVGPRKIEAFKRQLSPKTKLLGVTIPTDVSDDIYEKAHGRNIASAAGHLVNRVVDFIDGTVSASGEIASIKQWLEDKDIKRLLCTTPNVRHPLLPVKDDDQNQKRSSTVVQAMRDKSGLIIMGRAILGASDINLATEIVLKDIAQEMHLN